MPIYRHRQLGVLMSMALGLGVVLTAVVLVRTPEQPVVVGLVLAVLLLCFVLFWSLSVEVTAEFVQVAFGPGIIRKRIGAADILDARIVRNPWYYGWGVRLTPNGWLVNVSGFDAVELELKSGRTFRIGTDEPQQLLSAIRKAARLSTR